MLAALILSIVPAPDGVLIDRVDVVELNTVLDHECEVVFDQVIWWDWSAYHGQYRVRAWRLLKDDCRGLAPVRRPDGTWRSRWWDVQDDVRREIHAAMYRRTRTQYDPEIEDRKILPVERRVGVRRPVKRYRGGVK